MKTLLTSARCRILLAALLTLWTLGATGQAFDRATMLWQNRVNWFPIQTSADTKGNLYIAGYFSDTAVIGNITLIDVDTQPFGDTFEGVVAKFDSLGICQWALPISGNAYDLANSVAVDSAGDVYVCGYFTSVTNRLSCRVEFIKFYARLFGGELPVGFDVSGVSFGLPGLNFTDQFVFCGDRSI